MGDTYELVFENGSLKSEFFPVCTQFSQVHLQVHFLGFELFASPCSIL